MGITALTLEMANNLKPDQWIPIELMVDSGAIYSVIPTTLLRRLGIRPEGRYEFVLADGSVVTRRTGAASFRCKGITGPSRVVFGEPSDSPLLGVVTLEELGLSLDPVRGELKPLPMIIGGWRPEPRPRGKRRSVKRQPA